MSSRKRTRQSGVPFREGPSRPIDKELKAIQKTVGSSNTSTTLKTTTFPCTLLGIRWVLNGINTDTAANQHLYWAIVVVRDGNSVATIGTGDGSDFYTPEQNVLSFGVLAMNDADATGPVVAEDKGSTKTMRKLMGGDTVELVLRGTSASTTVRGVIQFFCKT